MRIVPSCGTLVDSEKHVGEKREADGDETEVVPPREMLGVGAPRVGRRGRGDRRGAHSQAWTYFGSFEKGCGDKIMALPRGDVSIERQRWRRAALRENVLLQIGGGLGEVGGAAEVAPIILVGAEG